MKNIIFLMGLAFLIGCSYYPSTSGPVHPTPVGEFIKCISADTHHLPTCYCSEYAVKANPERERVCFAAERSDLKILASETVSREDWLFDFRVQTAKLERYESDANEFWSNNTLDYLQGNEIIDDCDGLDSILDVLFLLGEFRLEELAKILMQVPDNDPETARYHYAAAVWVAGDWLILDQSSAAPLSLSEITAYGSAPLTVLAHRRLNDRKWREGLPPNVRTLAGYW